MTTLNVCPDNIPCSTCKLVQTDIIKSIERGKQGDRTQLVLMSLHPKAIPDELKCEVFKMYCQNLSSIKIGDVSARTLRNSSGGSSHVVLSLHNIGVYAKLAGTNPQIRRSFIQHWDIIAQWLLLLSTDYICSTEDTFKLAEESGRKKTICWTIFKQVVDNRIEEIWTKVRTDKSVYELYWLLYKHCIEEPFARRVEAVLVEKFFEVFVSEAQSRTTDSDTERS